MSNYIVMNILRVFCASRECAEGEHLRPSIDGIKLIILLCDVARNVLFVIITQEFITVTVG